MAGNVIDIVIKASDQSGGTLDKLNTGFKSLTGFSLSAAGGIALAGKAVDTLYKFMRDAVMETEKYVTSITDMSRVLGMSTEETSRLVQAADDLFISQDKLNTAMLAASRKGIDVTISGLKELSEQYLALAPGVDRAQFLMKTFGRSGADMGKLMEVGADGIDKATESVAKNLIVTAQSKIQIEHYKQSVDNLEDAWKGFKYTIGNAVIPTLDLLLRQLTPGIDAVEAQELKIAGLNRRLTELKFGYEHGAITGDEYKKQVAEVVAEIDKENESLSVLQGSLSEATDKTAELTEKNKNFISMVASFTTAQNNYQKGLEGASEAIADSQKNLDYWTAVVARAPSQVKELTAKVEALEAAGDTSSKTYKDAKEKLEDWNNTLSHGPGYLSTLKDKLGENEQKVKDLQAAYERETNQVILGYLQQKAMADGVLTDDEMQWLLEKGVEWGIYSETAINKMKLVQAEWENWTPTNKGATFTVTTKGIGNGTVVNNGNGISMEAKAGGGPVSGNTPYIVGESGPEMFIPNGGGKIVPNSQLGGGVSTISEASIMHLAKVIASEMQKVSG